MSNQNNFFKSSTIKPPQTSSNIFAMPNISNNQGQAQGHGVINQAITSIASIQGPSPSKPLQQMQPGIQLNNQMPVSNPVSLMHQAQTSISQLPSNIPASQVTQNTTFFNQGNQQMAQNYNQNQQIQNNNMNQPSQMVNTQTVSNQIPVPQNQVPNTSWNNNGGAFNTNSSFNKPQQQVGYTQPNTSFQPGQNMPNSFSMNTNAQQQAQQKGFFNQGLNTSTVPQYQQQTYATNTSTIGVQQQQQAIKSPSYFNNQPQTNNYNSSINQNKFGITNTANIPQQQLGQQQTTNINSSWQQPVNQNQNQFTNQTAMSQNQNQIQTGFGAQIQQQSVPQQQSLGYNNQNQQTQNNNVQGIGILGQQGQQALAQNQFSSLPANNNNSIVQQQTGLNPNQSKISSFFNVSNKTNSQNLTPTNNFQNPQPIQTNFGQSNSTNNNFNNQMTGNYLNQQQPNQQFFNNQNNQAAIQASNQLQPSLANSQLHLPQQGQPIIINNYYQQQEPCNQYLFQDLTINSNDNHIRMQQIKQTFDDQQKIAKENRIIFYQQSGNYYQDRIGYKMSQNLKAFQSLNKPIFINKSCNVSNQSVLSRAKKTDQSSLHLVMNKKLNWNNNSENCVYFDKVDFELEPSVLVNEKIILDFDVRYKIINFNTLIESIPVNVNIWFKDLCEFILETLLQKYNINVDQEHQIQFYFNNKFIPLDKSIQQVIGQLPKQRLIVFIKQDASQDDINSNDNLCTQDMLPWFTKNGYTLKPDLVDMSRMTIQELMNVKDFQVFNQFGCLTFPGITNLVKENLDSISIMPKQVEIYPADMYGGKNMPTKPPIGTWLNKECIITFYCLYQKGEKRTEQEWLKAIIKKADRQQMHFISFDQDTKYISFKVEHF